MTAPLPLPVILTSPNWEAYIGDHEDVIGSCCKRSPIQCFIYKLMAYMAGDITGSCFKLLWTVLPLNYQFGSEAIYCTVNAI